MNISTNQRPETSANLTLEAEPPSHWRLLRNAIRTGPVWSPESLTKRWRIRPETSMVEFGDLVVWGARAVKWEACVYPRTEGANAMKTLPNTSGKPRPAPSLMGAAELLLALFPANDSRPSVRWLRHMQSRWLPRYKKIGRRVFFDPYAVRLALDRQFSVHARNH